MKATTVSETVHADPDDLEAQAHEKIAEGHALLAKAQRLRSKRTTNPSADVVDVRRWAKARGLSERGVVDAGRRGDFACFTPAGRVRGLWARVSDLEGWLLGRDARKPVTASEDAPIDDAVRAAVLDFTRRVG